MTRRFLGSPRGSAWLGLGLVFVGASATASLGGGSIRGTVAWTGAPVKAELLKKQSDPGCGKKEAFDETVLLSKDGKALANVVVRLSGPQVPKGKVPSSPVVIDQADCVYRPRVVAVMEGQKLEIRNSDPTLHNVHSYVAGKTLFNQAQPPGAKPIDKEAKGGDVLKFKCDVHPWMTGYAVLHSHPFFAVSDASGAYEIKDVPPGKYTVETWHETLGTKTAEVTVVEGQAASPSFSYSDQKK